MRLYLVIIFIYNKNWRHSPKCFGTFHGMFKDIPRNVWLHSAEHKIPPIHHVPRIPFHVSVFLVLYIAVKVC